MTCTRHFCYVLASLCGGVIFSNAYINSAKANYYSRFAGENMEARRG